jgi:hypothetical protein
LETDKYLTTEENNCNTLSKRYLIKVKYCANKKQIKMSTTKSTGKRSIMEPTWDASDYNDMEFLNKMRDAVEQQKIGK